MRGILMSVRVKRVGSEKCRPLPVRPQFQTRCTALRDAMGQERPLSGFHCAARRSTFRELQRCLDGNLHMSNARQVMRRVVVSAALLCIWDGRHAMADPVKIAYADVFPPFTELKDGKAEGLAVEIVRAGAFRTSAKNLRGWTGRRRISSFNYPRTSCVIRLQRSVSSHGWRALRT